LPGQSPWGFELEVSSASWHGGCIAAVSVGSDTGGDAWAMPAL
jgi:hypothetical protein